VQALLRARGDAHRADHLRGAAQHDALRRGGQRDAHRLEAGCLDGRLGRGERRARRRAAVGTRDLAVDGPARRGEPDDGRDDGRPGVVDDDHHLPPAYRLDGFLDLAKALISADRKLRLLPPVERGVYDVERKVAAPRIKVGADVLPWWPVKGVYLLLERGATPADRLVDVDGVAGVWSAASLAVDERMASAQAGQSITYCFLDDDPVVTAERLRPALEKRWSESVEPLLAGPFYPVVPYQWDRYVP